ncbi:polysaccharide pyruvyl transferase family protein [Oceanobacillus salinisoli]|uniref:polysaccharide pyruvyl transferase family protein n=1 Tax=Oceanobacillus salinisoli TaxID=2678611 RepID=UPI0018CC04FD|nr:polysaccharide pyruvyl transferase family protein [Oceanobacillus salinisoli]
MVNTINNIDSLPPIEEQRQTLRQKKILANEYYRVLHIGRYAFGKTDIVSRMKHALENLGHTVFDFNTDDFREVIHNPDGHTGGFGPIEIKLEYIKPVLEQFDPQIILCNAGGYTFSEEDSQWLKDRGFILVGITLSDPDVFVSTKKFAHRFDYHVTNAIEAIKMYEDVGITNTMHFPFAIDRTFIETEAIERKDWNADVICIGNATNREDRNKMMKYLDQYFDVKVYGTGWDFPDSFPVSGEDFYSAARAGKFHINFPGTRAGYTNLKIGVFESIANGGILCTEYFDEMELFFEYGKEIIGYKDAEDLKEKLEYYLEHPEEAEQMRRRAFYKLVHHHMWESRWEDLFAQIKQDINVDRKKLTKKRYEEIGELHGTKERAAKVIVQGYYGALNTGDDLILESISNNIKKNHPNTVVMVAGFNRRNITLRQGYYSLPRTDVYRMEKFIKEADLLIYGGGGLLNDYSFNNSAGVADFFDSFPVGLTGMGIIPTMANIHEVPRMYFALGVGPLRNPEARKFAKFLVNQMSVVTVRDQYSKDLLESIDGINNEVIKTSDPTYMLDYPGTDLADKYLEKNNINPNEKLVLVTLREWKGNPIDFEEKMAKYLDAIISQSGYSVLFLPYQFGTGNSDDNRIHRKVLDSMTKKDKTYIYEHEGDYEEFLSLIGKAELVISMRLHGSILANRFGVPSIGFNYDNKVLAHYQNMNMTKYLLDLDFDTDYAVNLFAELKLNRDYISKEITEYVFREREESSKTFNYAVELLKDGIRKEKNIYRHYPREESLREMRVKTLNKELRELKEQKRDLFLRLRTLNNTVGNLRNMKKSLNGLNLDHIQTLDLSNAKFESEIGKSSEEIVVALTKNKLGIRLSDLDAPKKGDFSSAKVNLDLEPGNEYILNVDVQSPYYNPKNTGRIKYFILIDGKKVYSKDIAVEEKQKQLAFKVYPKKQNVVIEFKLEALKNCENWSWGRVSKTYFSNLSVVKMENIKRSKNVFKRTIRKH